MVEDLQIINRRMTVLCENMVRSFLLLVIKMQIIPKKVQIVPWYLQNRDFLVIMKKWQLTIN